MELFEMYLSKIKVDFSITVFSPRLAQLTPGMSGEKDKEALFSSIKKNEELWEKCFNFHNKLMVE